MTIGFRQFAEDCSNPSRHPIMMLEIGSGFQITEMASPVLVDWNCAVPSYDFGSIPSNFALDEFNDLRARAFAIGDEGRFNLPHEEFAVLFNAGPARLVCMVHRDETGQADDQGKVSPYWAQCFIHHPRLDRFEHLGQAALGSWSVNASLQAHMPKDITDQMRVAPREKILRGAAHALDVAMFLLHLRTEDQIIRWQMLPPSNAHKAMNYRRKQAGEDEVPTTRVVYVSPEPLNEWIGVQSRAVSKGTHASPVPHDRRGYYRRPRGGTEKSVWVRAAKVRGGAKEPVSYEVRLRTAPVAASL
ncbi:MAG TPA: hypothetical protein VGO06_01760 [Bosea sp. (in: a-proteobacteria)]|uniref:hypothetical protein n=1 Tax=Bosea sp. (in: a-proteobacteria) TaxID=1871050 RepID=UPI002E13D677|nr:hypothetical protein [Bosea sp. (in: a-proteobacteria)]